MDWYPWIVFVHAATILLFFIAHGASMAVAFAIRNEQDPNRVRALLDLSRGAVGPVPSTMALIGLLTGIAAGFVGDWWGHLWIWLSLALLLVVAFAMTPLMAMRLNAMRAAAGQPNPRDKNAPAIENLEELRRLQAAWNPLPFAAVALTAFVVILYLMLVKPF
jgi:hypothetical protein